MREKVLFIYLLCLFLPLSLKAQDVHQELYPPSSQDGVELPDLKNIRFFLNPFSYSEGYILGRVINANVRGFPIRTFEADVLLGLSSARGGIVDQECLDQKTREISARGQQRRAELRRAQEACTIYINPWHVSSFNRGLVRLFKDSESELVMLRYKAYFLHPFLDSGYYLKEVIPVNEDYVIPESSMDVSDDLRVIYRGLQYGRGHFDGRIVVAGLNGVVRKSYEVIIQTGMDSNDFRIVGVSHQPLFDYMVQVMATGRPVRVHFIELFDIQAFPGWLLKGYVNNLRAVRVEFLNP